MKKESQIKQMKFSTKCLLKQAKVLIEERYTNPGNLKAKDYIEIEKDIIRFKHEIKVLNWILDKEKHRNC